MTTSVISFKNVGLSYRRSISPFADKEWVLNDISFDLYKGEVLGVIGRNGAGKSTLLKLLADIINPDRGTITRDSSMRSQLLSLALGFNDKLNGYDNALTAQVMLGKTIKEAKQAIPHVQEFSGLGDLMDHMVGTYSSGERARLGFAIAMQVLPDILLLDEVLSVGDKDFRQKSAEEIMKRLRGEQTTVLVTHSPERLKEFCGRVLWIEHGKVAMLGSTEEVVKAYNNHTV